MGPRCGQGKMISVVWLLRLHHAITVRPFATASLFLALVVLGRVVKAEATGGWREAVGDKDRQKVPTLEQGWAAPPVDSRIRAYWLWLNGNVTKEAITRDLEGMAAKGFGGALIVDAAGPDPKRVGNDPVPHGPTFLTPQWRMLYKHALNEADRLGLEMSLNIQSGWPLGGPSVKAEEAPKKLVWSETRVSGPSRIDQALKIPKHSPQLYGDIAVVAFPAKPDAESASPRAAIQQWEHKALHKALGSSTPDCTPLVRDVPGKPGEEDVLAKDVLDVTDRMGKDGVLRWDAPAGAWWILRFGYTLGNRCRIPTGSEGWQGYALDPLDPEAFRSYWRQVVDPLIDDAGPLAGRVLKYLFTESWEIEPFNWTSRLCDEFRRRRGYDLLPFLPVLAGRIVDSRSISNEFLHDFRKTIGDLIVDNHYRLFVEWAHARGLLINPESGGPHAVPIDALRCLGINDVPMAEFWARSWKHRVKEADRFFVKQPASAAHTYGHRLVAAEGLTIIGPHWQEPLWDNLKPSFDQAVCEGMNQLVWSVFTCSPKEMGLPGQEFFACTHFNPNSTWWPKSASFLSYLNRCQYLLQKGLFVADAIYYYGDHVPNFSQLKASDPAHVLPGYDYDVASEEVLLTRVSVRDGRLVLPDGMSYRVLVLPNLRGISLPVIRKLRELVDAGASVIGPRPDHATGLTDYPRNNEEVARLAQELWGDCNGKSVTSHRFGKGRVIWGQTTREVLLADGVKPDMEAVCDDADTKLDYIHRRDGDAEIYFLRNTAAKWAQARCTFRVAGKAPEHWDPITSRIRLLPQFTQADGRTSLPLRFPPYGSMFVIFRRSPSVETATRVVSNFPTVTPVLTLDGPWQVKFDQKWGGPEITDFPQLVSWAERPESGIRFYSGTATYLKTFDVPEALRTAGKRVMLDLGNVRQLAEVRLNGKNLGVLWAMPFSVDVTDAVRPKDNSLEIEVVNFWSNRVIGDQSLPPDQRRTRTNIRKLTKKTPLMESGLMGPVILQVTE